MFNSHTGLVLVLARYIQIGANMCWVMYRDPSAPYNTKCRLFYNPDNAAYFADQMSDVGILVNYDIPGY